MKAIKKTLHSSKGKVLENLICSDFSLKMDKSKLQNRNTLFSTFLKNQQDKFSKLTKKQITITLPDGKILKGLSYETTPLHIASQISKALAKRACVARVTYLQKPEQLFPKVVDCDEEEQSNTENQSQLIDMNSFLETDCKIEILDFSSPEGKQTFWHSSAHILGKALETVYGGFLTHGPPLESGFFYDAFLGKIKLTPEDYSSIESAAKQLIKQKVLFEKVYLTKQEALQLFSDNPFKIALIKAKIKEDELTSAYRCGDLIDLCTGPHLNNTEQVKAFHIENNSAAYWLGKQDLDDLQRVYAISFPSEKELKAHIKIQKMLKQIDHRYIGQQQQLFHISDIAPGCVFFLPHGTRIFNRLVDMMRNQYHLRGFSEVNTPTMFKNQLWQTSGHYYKYKEDMFFVKTKHEEFGIKPMNCPSHCVLFGSKLRSYRDLPIRFADFGVLHRNEHSGSLTGLTRVRKFHQDDAHIFCRADQIEEEILGQLKFVVYVYSLFGFECEFELSTMPDNHLGSVEMWQNAEKSLGRGLDKFGRPWKVNPKDGAFYGPKIDIKVSDVYKRKHQLGTIQLDFNLPIRFNLQYKSDKYKEEKKPKNSEVEKQKEECQQKKEVKDEEIIDDDEIDNFKESDSVLKNGFERPIIVHRAILGSLERCMAIIIEHLKGKWPFWLSPRQIKIVPVSQKYNNYANKVYNKLLLKNYFVETDLGSSTMKKKIREAQLEQYNYIIIVGEQEQINGSVNVRVRDSKKPLGEMSMSVFFDFLEQQGIDKSDIHLQYIKETVYDEEGKKRFEESGLSLEELSKWDKELKQKSFFSKDGYPQCEIDEKRYKIIKEAKIDLDMFENLSRWFKTCCLLYKQI